MLRTNETPDLFNQEFVDLTRFSLFLEGKKIDIEKPQARSLYGHFISEMSTTPTVLIEKYNKIYNTANYQENIFSLSFQIALDTKLREFHYKIFHRIYLLYKQKAFQI